MAVETHLPARVLALKTRPRIGPRCESCRRIATGLDGDGDPECGVCYRLRTDAKPDRVDRLAGLCARYGTAAPEALAAALGVDMLGLYVRVEWQGFAGVVRRAGGTR